MKNVPLVKQVGAVAIIAGTAVGAGMLGIPFAVAAVGFKYAVILLFVVWAIMFATAMLFVEATSSQPIGTDLDSISHNLLGKLGRLSNLVFYILLLYSLITAYIFMGGHLFQTYIFGFFGITSNAASATIFCAIFGFVIYMGIRTVFRVNEIFLSLKIIAFVMFIAFVSPHIQESLLTEQGEGFKYSWFAIPILVTSFGFHIVIPSIRNYFDNDVVFRRTIAIGAVAPLIVYLVWIFATLGTISLYGVDGFIDLNHTHATLAEGYASLGYRTPLVFIKMFENFAIITSFLGVALSLYSFNRDFTGFNVTKRLGKLSVLAITLVPPLIFAMYFVNSFISALGYASIFVAVLLIILPALMVWVVRKKESRNTLFSKLYLTTIIFSGVVIIALQFLVAFGKLSHI